jgi:DNA adenine methylase
MINNATPLRYPGGKQKLAPFIFEIMQENNLVGGDYVEPYAGGAGVAISLLLSGAASKIHLNDSSYPVFSFWHSILNETEKFCRRISRAALTIDEWRKKQYIFLNPIEFDKLDVGFATFYLNRCNRSGILNAGVIGGLNQDGKWKMDARFSRNSLINRIELIATHKKNIKIRNWDAEKFIVNYISKLPKKTLIYFDPPYFKKSKKLYVNHYEPEDHERISCSIQSISRHPWIVSYDNAKKS